LMLVSWNPYSGITDRKAQNFISKPQRLKISAPTLLGHVDAEMNCSLMSKLERIGEEILKHLLDALGVSVNELGQLWSGFQQEIELLIKGDLAEGSLHKLLEVSQRNRSNFDLHSPRFNLRKIQNVVNQLEQVASSSMNRFYKLNLLCRQVFFGILN